MWSGCSSKAIWVTPDSSARRTLSVQNRTPSAQLRWPRVTASSGHGYQVQLKVVAPGPSPGQPDIDTILVTPSSWARRSVFSINAEWAGPRTGCIGQAEQLSAAILKPRASKALRKLVRAGWLAKSSSTFRCGALDWPPVAISIERTPLVAAMSSACSNECSVSESVYRPISTEAPCQVGCAESWRSRRVVPWYPCQRLHTEGEDDAASCAGGVERRTHPMGSAPAARRSVPGLSSAAGRSAALSPRGSRRVGPVALRGCPEGGSRLGHVLQ